MLHHINMELYVRNLPHSVIAGVVNEVAGEAILPTEAPQLPVYDYSLDAFVYEDPALHGWSKFLGATGVTMLLPGGIAKHAGTALKGTSVGRMFTGISKVNNRLVETVVGQAKHLLGKAVLPRATARAKQVAEGIAGAPARVAPNRGLSRLFGHNEYKVVDPAKVAKVKSGLFDYYTKHGGAGIEYVDDAILRGRNGALNTETGAIQISKGLRDKYPHLVEGTILEELQHFHQLKSRGWFGRILTQAEHDRLENEVIQRLLRSGLEIFE